ncbi:MAG: hypothetical protein HY996_00060 [Micrococcales bacterium]|nr:hypothetical protein [Micrococcales bacterium]
MPIRKFRAIEEMTPPLEARPCDAANLRAAIELSRTCISLRRYKLPSGVHKHRSIEEANEARRRLDDSSA